MFQHSSTGISFAYAGYLDLYYQMAILVTVALVGAVGFTFVDVRNQRSKRKAKSEEAKADKDEDSVDSNSN